MPNYLLTEESSSSRGDGDKISTDPRNPTHGRIKKVSFVVSVYMGPIVYVLTAGRHRTSLLLEFMKCINDQLTSAR